MGKVGRHSNVLSIFSYKFYTSYHDPERIKRSIPPNSYVWNSYSFGNRKADFKTILKLSITANQQTINIKPLEITVDRSQALGMKETILRNIDLCLSGEEQTTFNREQLILEKVNYLYKLNKKEEALALIAEEWDKNKAIVPDRALYMKMKLLFLLSKKSRFSKAEQYLLRNAAFTAYHKIKPEKRVGLFNEKEHRLRLYFQKFYDKLLNRQEWDAINDLDCVEKGNQYYCYEGKVIKDYVMIRYKENPIILDTSAPFIGKNDRLFNVVEELSYTPDIPDCTGLSDAESQKACFKNILTKYIYKHLVYPDLASRHKIEGTVVLKVKVDPINKIYGISGIKDIGGGAERAALAAMNQTLQELLKEYKLCSGKWKPSKDRKQTLVEIHWLIPVKFELNKKD